MTDKPSLSPYLYAHEYEELLFLRAAPPHALHLAAVTRLYRLEERWRAEIYRVAYQIERGLAKRQTFRIAYPFKLFPSFFSGEVPESTTMEIKDFYRRDYERFNGDLNLIKIRNAARDYCETSMQKLL